MKAYCTYSYILVDINSISPICNNIIQEFLVLHILQGRK